MHVELVVPPTTKPNAKPNSKMFPVLVFLLMACYGIMALVVVEQGRVLQSQRNLIQQLVQDSHQLTAFKIQAAAQQAIEKKQANATSASANSPPASRAPRFGQAVTAIQAAPTRSTLRSCGPLCLLRRWEDSQP